MKTAAELNEYIDHVIASLQSDYGVIFDATRVMYDRVPAELRNRLEWNLVHQHTNLEMFLTDLKRHQQLLSKDVDASTTL